MPCEVVWKWVRILFFFEYSGLEYMWFGIFWFWNISGLEYFGLEYYGLKPNRLNIVPALQSHLLIRLIALFCNIKEIPTMSISF